MTSKAKLEYKYFDPVRDGHDGQFVKKVLRRRAKNKVAKATRKKQRARK